jgi:hypothetical protein
MSMGTPAQRRLAKKFFGPFFNWEDDDKLREWLRQQDPDELEQFLNWFNFGTHRDRETLGRQELRKLLARVPQDAGVPNAEKQVEAITLKPGIWGMSIDLKEMWRRSLYRWTRR